MITSEPLLIFDFDGTLVDTAPDIVASTNQLFSELGLPAMSEDQIKINVGQGLTELLAGVLPQTKSDQEHRIEVVQRFLTIYETRYLNSPRLYAGVEEILRTWPHPKAILSNKSSHFIHGILRHLSLDQLGWVDIIGGNTFKTKKPEPEGLLHILEKSGIPMSQAVMIGDGNPDADLAKRTGIRCIAIDFGYGDIDELLRRGASIRLSHYRDLAKVLDSILR